MEHAFDGGRKELTCHFAGDIKSSNCEEAAKALGEALAAAFGEGALPADARVTFDLGRTEYVSSDFMRVVLRTAKRLAPGNFAVEHANPFVKELFRTSGLDNFLRDAGAIESRMAETRAYAPPAGFAGEANWGDLAEYERQHARSLERPEEYWAEKGRELLVWDKPFDRALAWECPQARWFEGGRLNASVQCLDVHLKTATANKAALIWEGEPCSATRPGEERSMTYAQLHRAVCRFANVLRRNGVGKGDRVIVYMPLVPEAVVAMLACARIGAVHSVVFGGFSAAAIADRVRDCGAKAIVTADGGYRKGATVPLKKNVDEALALRDGEGRLLGASVEKVVVLRRTGQDVRMKEGRDAWWHEELESVGAQCEPESMESEDLLFILYTSGSTGKPKGIMHSTAGYMLNCKLTHGAVFDVKPTDVYWCTADVGWITGHSYVVYGPLANGATVFLYEGAPNYPEPDRFWALVEKYGVTVFYTAPTAIRSFMQWGDEWPGRRDLSTLRLLGTVGEPINPQAWTWYYETIGKGRCPIVDTWWQTETGAIMISTLPGAMAAKPGSAGRPMFGIDPQVVDDEGREVSPDAGGKLVVRRPWPSMLRGVWGDAERYRSTYWGEYEGIYFTGDGARRDGDGYHWIMGRIDDVINVSGHRIGTAEVESALVAHPAVAEAAAVGRPDDVKGSGLVVFATLVNGRRPSAELREELRRHVGAELGPVARPDEIRFAETLPKTRSGKIMRRLLKQIAAGEAIAGDLTTLDDFGALQRLSGEEGG